VNGQSVVLPAGLDHEQSSGHDPAGVTVPSTDVSDRTRGAPERVTTATAIASLLRPGRALFVRALRQLERLALRLPDRSPTL